MIVHDSSEKVETLELFLPIIALKVVCDSFDGSIEVAFDWSKLIFGEICKLLVVCCSDVFIE